VRVTGAVDTLIFDAEGVVVDTEPLWDTAQREFLERHGRVYERDEVKHLLAGRSSVEGMRVLQQALDLRGAPEELAAERMNIAREHFDQVDYVTGFRPFFASVADSFKTALATAMDPELLQLVDARLRFTSLFGGRVTTLRDVDGRGKPAPELFLHAAASVGSDARSCVVLEDAPNGVEAARAAGMRCIALTTTFDAPLLGEADLVVSSYDEIDLDGLHDLGAS
jgi:beta-phosphoglucomutase-like phosphatase (HAD superfamily)